MKHEIRFCGDINMFSFDRPVSTCKHCTSFCSKNCYNRKLYDLYKAMTGKDLRNEAYWQSVTGTEVKQALDKKRKQTTRVRFMTRGEALSTSEDFDKVIDICKANPDRLFWLPTRAWRKAEFKTRIENELFPIENLRVLASLDPSNSPAEVNSLVAAGWSTMFFGNDEQAPIENSVKCAKTWEHDMGHCSKCENGCFAAGQKHIWLKQH